MTEMSEGELMGIFAEILGVDRGVLSEQSSPESVRGWDSAKSMEIVISIEEALSLEFSAGELAEMTSIGAIKKILTRRGVVIPE
jgi:acyl carrier protein